MKRDDELAWLTDAFLKSLSRGRPDSDDPPPERIWDAARGRLSPKETRAVLDRVSASPACAEAWWIACRIAATVREDDQEAVLSAGPPVGWRRSARLALPAAAALVLTASGVAAWLAFRPGTAPVYRGDAARIESLVEERAGGTGLPRNGATLRWKGVDGAGRYVLRILEADLDVLLVEEDLTAPVFVVPEAALAGIASGESILWQVEAVFPDGTRLLSETFRATIAGPAPGAPPEGDRR